VIDLQRQGPEELCQGLSDDLELGRPARVVFVDDDRAHLPRLPWSTGVILHCSVMLEG
jgi:hypothetical protein